MNGTLVLSCLWNFDSSGCFGLLLEVLYEEVAPSMPFCTAWRCSCYVYVDMQTLFIRRGGQAVFTSLNSRRLPYF